MVEDLSFRSVRYKAAFGGGDKHSCHEGIVCRPLMRLPSYPRVVEPRNKKGIRRYKLRRFGCCHQCMSVPTGVLGGLSARTASVAIVADPPSFSLMVACGIEGRNRREEF